MSERTGERRLGWSGAGYLALIALTIFVILYVIDHFITGGNHLLQDNDGVTHPGHPVERFLRFDPEMLTDAVSALAAMIAAVLGIVITVVSIIVQLSADRYTGVATMFLRDRTNRAVLVYYVIACVSAVWLSVSLHTAWVPRAFIVLIILATTFGLVLMLPYFQYVFRFLEPTNIVDRIRQEAVRNVLLARPENAAQYAALQEASLKAMEELTDITSNSISGKDKIIASRAVDALKDYCLDYLEVKRTLLASIDEDGGISLSGSQSASQSDALATSLTTSLTASMTGSFSRSQIARAVGRARRSNADDWFRIGDRIRDNPDFVAMAPESLADLETRRHWFEWKILRQYLGIYNEALKSMRDINYLIAIDTRYIGEKASEHGDHELIALVFRYMNSYLRSALNAKDVRTAYNVLNQYRLLCETMLRRGYGEAALDGVKRMMYYGNTSYDMALDFVTITVAFDVSSLCQVAHEIDALEHDEMLERFLELDQPLHVQNQERVVLGVRKAQVKLAAYYLTAGSEDKARLIAEDMTGEKSEVLLRIRHELEQVEDKDFWEIIDRGRDFEFIPLEQRVQMAEFFSWLGINERVKPTRPLTDPPVPEE